MIPCSYKGCPSVAVYMIRITEYHEYEYVCGGHLEKAQGLAGATLYRTRKIAGPEAPYQEILDLFFAGTTAENLSGHTPFDEKIYLWLKEKASQG